MSEQPWLSQDQGMGGLVDQIKANVFSVVVNVHLNGLNDVCVSSPSNSRLPLSQ